MSGRQYPGPTGKRLVLEISKATAYAGQPIQCNLAVLDSEGAGIGTRLMGPKYGGSGSKILRTADMDERARQDIRRSLDEVEGKKSFRPCEHGNTYGECVLANGHEEHETADIGRTPEAMHVDRWGDRWNVAAGS